MAAVGLAAPPDGPVAHLHAVAAQWAQTVLMTEHRLGADFAAAVAKWREDPEVQEFARNAAARIAGQPVRWWPPGKLEP